MVPPLQVLDLYEYPTIASMAAFLKPKTSDDGNRGTTAKRQRQVQVFSGDLAVVGMAGRFPGADSIDEFWENLKVGKDSLRKFTKEELQVRFTAFFCVRQCLSSRRCSSHTVAETLINH